MRRSLAVLALFFATATAALAQNTSALINEALDRQFAMELNSTLPAAIDKIKAETGVPIRVEPDVWDLLPWGQQTIISAKFENLTLRQSLDAITRKLGLTYALQEEAVELRPLPPLKRLGKRATPTELQALDTLMSTPLGLTTDRTSVQQLLAAVDQKLVDTKSTYAIENRAGESLKSDQVVPITRNATLADALDALAVSTPATWYPWGKSIVIVTKADQVRNLLQSKTISIRYNGVELPQVLMELSQRAGVDFDVQPGAIQSVPAEFRSIRLMFENVSVKQALDSLAGFTGLAWTVNEKGVYVWSQQNANAAAAPRDPVVGILQLPNGMQLLLPKSQVPPDVQEYLRQKTDMEIAKIRQMMKEEGFKPSTQPTTAPTDERL